MKSRVKKVLKNCTTAPIFFAKLLRSKSGVGAIEFAFLAPVLVGLYIGVVEISVALSVNKKLARSTATVADLITQTENTNKSQLLAMSDVAESIISPFENNSLALKVTGIAINNSGTPKVSWSWGSKVVRPYVTGVTIEIPDSLKIPNTFLIRSEMNLDHPMLTKFPFSGKSMSSIEMDDVFYFRPRIGSSISCSDC